MGRRRAAFKPDREGPCRSRLRTPDSVYLAAGLFRLIHDLAQLDLKSSTMKLARSLGGILQCVFALLLLAGQPGALPSPARAFLGISTSNDQSLVREAQPYKAAFKHETGQTLGITKRNTEPSPKILVADQWLVTPSQTVYGVRACGPPAPPLARHRPCASPPTGPPSA